MSKKENNQFVRKITLSDIKRAFSKDGIRDGFLILFGFIETIILRVFLMMPRPIRVIAIIILVADYINNLIFNGITSTIITAVITILLIRNLKKWNIELKIMKGL